MYHLLLYAVSGRGKIEKTIMLSEYSEFVYEISEYIIGL